MARRCQRLQRRNQAGSALRLSPAMISAHSAGVALIATSSDSPTASRKDVDRGRKKHPAGP